MHYTINISLKGRHFFATSDHSLQDRHSFQQCYATLKEKFPESEGYKVDATLWQSYGQTVNAEGETV